MKITYIGHSGFLVETETVSLLFDYWNGDLPEFPQDKPLYIFSSHRHEDHFNPEIFRMPGTPADSRWLLSFDILRDKRFYSKYPEAQSLRDTGRIFNLRMDNAYEIGDLEVWPLKSTDEGVGFLIGIPEEQQLIYHAGDLNWWIWDGEPEEQNRYYTGLFRKQVSILSELVKKHSYRSGSDALAEGSEAAEIPCLDLAFYTMDPRQEMYEFHGFDYYLQHIPTRIAFPMHCSEQYDVIDRYFELRAGLVEEWLPEREGISPDQACIYVPHIRRRGEVYRMK